MHVVSAAPKRSFAGPLFQVVALKEEIEQAKTGALTVSALALTSSHLRASTAGMSRLARVVEVSCKECENVAHLLPLILFLSSSTAIDAVSLLSHRQ
jgi:hypothetical protein